MIWKIEWSNAALKQLRKLDKQLQEEILDYLEERVAVIENPKQYGKPMHYQFTGLWRYRVRNARILCQIKKEKWVVCLLCK